MNNIDILEEKIKIIESLCTDDCINKETVIKPLKQAISNIIAENKELKEENEGLKTKLDTLIEKYKDLKEMLKHRIEYTNKLEKDLFQNASNYVIPKSKVEEVIKELEIMYDGLPKNPKEHLHSKTEYKIVIGVLQELLDERNKNNGN